MYYNIVQCMSAQQMDLLPENNSQNDTIYAQKSISLIGPTSQCLRSYGSAITVLYILHREFDNQKVYPA